MIARRIATECVLVFVTLFSRNADAFFDLPWLTPTTPVPGQSVSLNIHGGMCDGVLQEQGYPRFDQAGNSLRWIEYGFHYDPGSELCVDGVGTLTREIGAFPAGDYTLTIDMVYPHPVFGPTVLNIGVVPFTVTAQIESVSVPSLGSLGTSALLTLIFATFAWKLRERHCRFAMLLLIGLPFSTRAQDMQSIQIMLSDAPGAPTLEEVVTWLKASPRKTSPPLQAFTVQPPVTGDYLIPDRATGDFKAWLSANPNSARRKLEDAALSMFFSADLPAALAALKADPYVADAIVTPTYSLHAADQSDHVVEADDTLDGTDQYGWLDMKLDAAWQMAAGYALIGQVDMGLYENGVAFRQFEGSSYAGGNLIKAASRDIGLTGRPAQSGFDSMSVDEKKAMWIEAGPCTAVSASLQPAYLGHGTHVAGLLGANAASGLGVQGTCKHCGISMSKAAFLQCYPQASPPVVIPIFNSDAANRGRTQAVDTGAQVLSLSFGIPSHSGIYDCKVAYHTYAMCLAIDYAMARDVAQVASSGNVRQELDFPASDKRMISVGGFDENDVFWNDAPNCPAPPNGSQCGSNFSKLYNNQYLTHQQLLASAKRVLSTTYPNTTWADYAECGDGYGTPMGDGVGWCTGTSMSAPQIAGVLGLLRSINPLAPQGNAEPAVGEKAGLRTTLAETASRAHFGQAWDASYGYGIPDVADAARKMLGTAAGAIVRNRVTPLFRLWQASTHDFAETTSPQYALGLLINQDKNYVLPSAGLGAAPVIPGYAFPYDANDPNDNNDTFDTTLPPSPRAAIYVLTTEYRPRSEWPNLRPLHLMDDDAGGPKDYLLATTTAEIEAAHAAGYNLRTIQGYIYEPCMPEPACVPPGAQKLWREYKAVDSDCALFLDSERAGFEAAGYAAACSTGATKMIGYAYPATDGDGDGLPDGFEYAVGTNPNATDSDGDGVADGVELPMAGVPVGDPCMGGTLGARNCGADSIFRNGFEML